MRSSVANTVPRLRRLLLTALIAASPSLSLAESALDFRGCELSTPGTTLRMDAECAAIEVVENPAQPERRISLRVARVAARQPTDPPAMPVYFLAGGPGQAATEAWPMLAPTLRDIGRRHDVILVDQRGTGGSARLDCVLDEETLASPEDREQLQAAVRACLSATDADPRQYTTERAVEDLDQVRQALGHARIQLIGVSYGTRVAQHYQRRYPDAVDRMVLDGVVPPDLVLGTEHAVQLDAALQGIFARCRAEAACAEAFGNPADTLVQLLERIEAGDLPSIPFRNVDSGDREAITPSREILAFALRMLSYASETQALIPLVMARALEDDWEPLMAQAMLQSESLLEQLAHGMELSVLCAEDLPLFPDDLDQSDTLLGNLMVDALRTQCAVWPAGDLAEDFHRPQSQPLPVLVLSGEFDPVTPPIYGDRVLESFPNGTHWVLSGQGHGVLRVGCVPEQVAAFLDGAQPASAPVCLQRTAASPFFVDLNGPVP